MIDNATELFHVHPPNKGVGNALDAFVRDEVLGVALLEDLAGVDEEDLTLSGLGLIPVEEEDDAGGGGVVEEVFGFFKDFFGVFGLKTWIFEKPVVSTIDLLSEPGTMAGMERCILEEVCGKDSRPLAYPQTEKAQRFF